MSVWEFSKLARYFIYTEVFLQRWEITEMFIYRSDDKHKERWPVFKNNLTFLFKYLVSQKALHIYI